MPVGGNGGRLRVYFFGNQSESRARCGVRVNSFCIYHIYFLFCMSIPLCPPAVLRQGSVTVNVLPSSTADAHLDCSVHLFHDGLAD